MLLIVSSIVMLLFFAAIVAVERKSAARDKEVLGRADSLLEEIAGRATEKYREMYGKNPTVEFPVCKK